MQHILSINENILTYRYNKSTNMIMINDSLFIDLEFNNLDFSQMTLLIVGDDTCVELIKNLKFKEIIITSNIEMIDFNNINCIFNMTNDIIMSRQLTNKSFQYNIAFFDCNIDNYKLKSNIIIPFITEASSIESIYQEKSYLLCVLNNFPTDKDHCIKWAIEQFAKITSNSSELFIDLFSTKINSLLESIEEETWKVKCNKPIAIDYNPDLSDHKNFIEKTRELSCLELKFDKNNISHIMWIQYAANLRCDNYNITKPTLDDIKYSCGVINIMKDAQIMVCNLMIVEMIKYFNNYKNNNDYNNTFINLEDLKIVYNNPNHAKELAIGNMKMNSWTKLTYSTDSTLQEFKEHYEKYFETTISMILCESKMIYVEFMENDTSKKLLEIITNGSYITMMTDNDEDLPEVKIKI